MATPEVTAALAALESAAAAAAQAHVQMGETLVVVGQRTATLAALLDEDEPPASDVALRVVETTSRSIGVEWTVTGPEPAGWTIGRDGVDLLGTGAWSAGIAARIRSFTFSSLRSSTQYTITLTSPDGRAVSVTATTKAGELPPVDPGVGDTAAVRLGWGKPHPVSDEFGYTGQPDPMKWILPGPGWAGHNGTGRRLAECTTVRDGMMVMVGRANGDSGWVRQRLPTRYGRWEQRSRSRNTSGSGTPYHVLSLIWPTREDWPRSGELDWLETEDPDQRFFRAYLHYPHPPGQVQQEIVTVPDVDQTRWHNYAFEWTPEHLRGFIDGEQVYRLRGGAGPAGRSDIQAMPEGALTLQVDNFRSTRECVYEIDWVRFYPL